MLIYAGWLPQDLFRRGAASVYYREFQVPIAETRVLLSAVTPLQGNWYKSYHSWASCVSLSIAQIKALNSRAIAVTTVCLLLPLAKSRRYLAQSRVCAFQDISQTLLGNPCCRFKSMVDTRACIL